MAAMMAEAETEPDQLPMGHVPEENTDAELLQQLDVLQLQQDEVVTDGPTATENRGSADAETATISFCPPVYAQRYLAVKSVLQSFLRIPENQDVVNGRTIMEVGCAEFGLHVFLKRILQLGKIIYLDINEQLLRNKRDNLRPFPGEFIRRLSRPKALAIEAYAGDINFVDPKILQEHPPVWAVIAVELIEHLHPPDLRGFEVSVFGVINPHLVVITTPNSEFNVVFNLPPGKFRHWDHKFEWTRSEFEAWCIKITQEYPEYVYTIDGIGTPPANAPMPQGDIGCVSQLAVFEKISAPVPGPSSSSRRRNVKEGAYKLVDSLTYPNYIETRSIEEIIIDDIQYLHYTYWVSKNNYERCLEEGIRFLEFTLQELINRLPDSTIMAGAGLIDIQFMRRVLTDSRKYLVERNLLGEWIIRVYLSDYFARSRDPSDDEEEEQDGMDVDNGAAEL